MSNNAGNSGEIAEGQDKPETEMTDPENYGSLTIEDPDGGDVEETDSSGETGEAKAPSDQ